MDGKVGGHSSLPAGGGRRLGGLCWRWRRTLLAALRLSSLRGFPVATLCVGVQGGGGERATARWEGAGAGVHILAVPYRSSETVKAVHTCGGFPQRYRALVSSMFAINL